jgi:hypothetical protein
MILLSIFASAGSCPAARRHDLKRDVRARQTSCWLDHGGAAMGIFRATCESRSSPTRIAERSFHFLICHLAHIRVMCDGF